MRVYGLLGAGLLSACSQQPAPEQQWLDSTVSLIQNQYERFADESEHLSTTVSAFCQGGEQATERDVSEAQLLEAWQAAMAAWQTVQWVSFGPVSDENDDWKIQFWPDKKNIVARKMRGLFGGGQPITAATLAEASVVLQGLSALELLLYDPAFNVVSEAQIQPRRCAVAMAIGERLNATASSLAARWQQPKVVSYWTAATGDAEAAVQARQARVAEILDALLAQMERIKLDKLGSPLGYRNRQQIANGYLAESWRSQTSLKNIEANLESFSQLLQGNGAYDLERLLQAHGHEALAQTLSQRVDGLQQRLSELDSESVQTLLDSPESLAALQALYKDFGSLNSILKQQLAPALKVTLGFNANDGD